MKNALMPGEHNYQLGQPMPGQAAAPMASPQKKRNPLVNALSTVFEYGAPEAFEAGRQKRMTRDAGKALAGGNYEQAANTYLQGGNIEQGLKLRSEGEAQTTAKRQQEAQSVLSLFSQMPALQINDMAMSDPANFERMTGMTSEEYLAAAQRSGDPEKFREYVIAKAQAELGQMPAGPAEGKVVNNRLVDPITGEVRGDYSDPTKPPGYEQITLADGEYEYIPGQPESLRKLGDSPVKSPLVTVDASGKQQDAFAVKAGQLDAESFYTLSKSGQTASQNRQTLNQLETTLQTVPGGAEASVKNWLGKLGIETEGLSDIQAADALISKLIPAQREPGSGPMSDKDIDLFKQSLPRLMQSVEGRTKIMANMRAMNDYLIAEGKIANRVLSRQISAEEGRAQLEALGNPLAEYSQGSTSSGDLPPGFTLIE